MKTPRQMMEGEQRPSKPDRPLYCSTPVSNRSTSSSVNGKSLTAPPQHHPKNGVAGAGCRWEFRTAVTTHPRGIEAVRGEGGRVNARSYVRASYITACGAWDGRTAARYRIVQHIHSMQMQRATACVQTTKQNIASFHIQPPPNGGPPAEKGLGNRYVRRRAASNSNRARRARCGREPSATCTCPAGSCRGRLSTRAMNLRRYSIPTSCTSPDACIRPSTAPVPILYFSSPT